MFPDNIRGVSTRFAPTFFHLSLALLFIPPLILHLDVPALTLAVPSLAPLSKANLKASPGGLPVPFAFLFLLNKGSLTLPTLSLPSPTPRLCGLNRSALFARLTLTCPAPWV